MVTYIQSMDICGYKYNFKGLFEKFLYPMSITKERMMIPKSANTNFVENFLLSFLSLLAKSVEKEIQSF